MFTFTVVIWGGGYRIHWGAGKQPQINHQQTFTLTHRGNLKCLLQLSCMSVDCGRKVKCLEESHADTQRTCKPHTERISCLGTELFINCGRDHFWARCGFYSCELMCKCEQGSDNTHSAWRWVEKVMIYHPPAEGKIDVMTSVSKLWWLYKFQVLANIYINKPMG